MNIPNAIIMSSTDKKKSVNALLCEYSTFDAAGAVSVCKGPPVLRSKPARACSARYQLSILAALEDVDSDELSDIDVHKCSSDDNICDSSDLPPLPLPSSFRYRPNYYTVPGVTILNYPPVLDYLPR